MTDPNERLTRGLVDRKGSFLSVTAFGPQFVANARLPSLQPKACAVLRELGAEFSTPVRDGQFVRVGALAGGKLLVLARDTTATFHAPYETADGDIAVDPRSSVDDVKARVSAIVKKRMSITAP